MLRSETNYRLSNAPVYVTRGPTALLFAWGRDRVQEVRETLATLANAVAQTKLSSFRSVPSFAMS